MYRSPVVFNAPHNWPPSPEGWLPPTGWEPPRQWGSVPDGWDLFLELPILSAPLGDTAAHGQVKRVRTVPWDQAHPGYTRSTRITQADSTTRSILDSPLRLLRGMGRLPRRILLASACGVVMLSFLPSTVGSPSVALARTACAPVVAEAASAAAGNELANESPSNAAQSNAPNADLGAPRSFPRASPSGTGYQSSAQSRTTISASTITGDMLYAEGTYYGGVDGVWLFNCNVDTSGDPTDRNSVHVEVSPDSRVDTTAARS